MTITFNTDDPRTSKALVILASADRWLRCQTRDGGLNGYAVPSQTRAAVYHLVDVRSCTCQDFQRRQRACKHLLAVRLHFALTRALAAGRKEVVANL